MRYKKFRKSRGLFKMPSKKPPKPQPDAVYESWQVCPECRKPLTKKQIRQGNECCSYKCANQRKARLYFRGVKKPRKSSVF